MNAGIFDSLQIHKLIKNLCVVQSMTNTESAAWQSFVLVPQKFLGNRKAENYQELMGDVLSKFKDLGVQIGIKATIVLATLIVFLKIVVI